MAYSKTLLVAHTIWRRLKGKHRLEDLGVDGKIILKWVLNGILSEGPSGGRCEHSNKSSVFIKIANLILC
jgi:hypothetical protein